MLFAHKGKRSCALNSVNNVMLAVRRNLLNLNKTQNRMHIKHAYFTRLFKNAQSKKSRSDVIFYDYGGMRHIKSDVPKKVPTLLEQRPAKGFGSGGSKNFSSDGRLNTAKIFSNIRALRACENLHIDVLLRVVKRPFPA